MADADTLSRRAGSFLSSRIADVYRPIMSPLFALLLDGLRPQEKSYDAGDAVFHVGDPVQRMHFVREGVVILVRNQRRGSALILQRAGAGSVLAEASLYSERYHCDARAETAVTTWCVSRAELRRRIADSPDLSEAWSGYLAQEVQRARLHAEILSLRTVADRLDAWITCHGAPPAKGGAAAVALEIGVSHEALYREAAKRRAHRE